MSLILCRSIEGMADMDRASRPHCLGIWVSGGDWLGGGRDLRRRTVFVSLRSWSSSIDRFKRKHLLPGWQYVEGLSNDGLASAEIGLFW